MSARLMTEAGISEAGLGYSLCFVAGAVNAGGFMLVGHYTSHMSGIVSAMADNLAVAAWPVFLLGFLAFLSFTLGAACSAMLVNRGRQRRWANPYVPPLLLEALLLLAGGLGGAALGGARPWLGVPVLCFLMGLQNATVTKISGARIRTTHVTGIVTDIGIELGKLFYRNPPGALPFVRADRAKLRLLAGLLGSFFLGGVVGALGFGHVGFVFCLPVAAILLLLLRALPTAP